MSHYCDLFFMLSMLTCSVPGSAILLTTLACVSSVLFALGTVSQARTTTSFYTLMVAGRVMLAFGQSPLRSEYAKYSSNI